MADSSQNSSNPNAVEEDPGEGPSVSRASRIEILMNEGKRDYLDGFFELASQKLSNALSLSSEEYGDLSPECFEPCFYYAKTLVDWTRCIPNLSETEHLSERLIIEQLHKYLSQQQQSSSQLVNREVPNEMAVQDADQSKLNGSSETVSVEQDHRLETVQCSSGHSEGAANGSGEGNQQGESLPDKEVDKNKSQDGHPDSTAEDAQSKSETEDDQELGSCDDYEEDEDEGDEDSDRMAIAWNTLQDALLICENFADGGTKWAERKAETLFALAEWYLQDTDYEEAIEALKSSVELYPDSRDRRIAAAYYELAKAYELMGESQKVTESRQKASNLLVERLAFLEKESAKTMSLGASDDAKKCSVMTEIEDLKQIVSDLKEDLIALNVADAAEDKAVKESEQFNERRSTNGKLNVDDKEGGSRNSQFLTNKFEPLFIYHISQSKMVPHSTETTTEANDATVEEQNPTEQNERRQQIESLETLLADGKKAYIVGDLQTASDKLGEASALA
ncbi:unnamed protein product [Anisakis simplex]|uniref:Nuclear autoantigenic sperm protein (inferred by orthology to a human protein) n=1 Tax=Anisakis simplex TaxID=6269 RepID=A0A0M3K371_ANISI|nr:unnamed protein product [Anisakis simplex]